MRACDMKSPWVYAYVQSFFFFQAEDGIRDWSVTGVQTCALPILTAFDFGDHQRTIVSGMKQERADPREIEGRQALFVVNLPSRKMKGVMSEGMMFDIDRKSVV